jgi:hypothetical protein
LHDRSTVREHRIAVEGIRSPVRRNASSVVLLAGNDGVHAATRRRIVAPVARDQVNVRMEHGLTRSLAAVDAD